MSKEFIELKNKTIFITGVAGFIGSNLAERLLKEIEGIGKKKLETIIESYREQRELKNITIFSIKSYMSY